MQGDESKFPAPEGVEELQQDAARRTRLLLSKGSGAGATGKHTFESAAAAIRAAFGGAR